MDSSALCFRPSLDDLCNSFSLIVDTMVTCVQQVKRVEHFLFQDVEELPVRYVSSVGVQEELVEQAKGRLHTVIVANSHGPLK